MWILESLGARGMSVSNPPRHTNYIIELLHWKSEFVSTWIPLKFTSEDNIGRGEMTRGDISLTFWLDLKKMVAQYPQLYTS
jgi:hypothetical protein